MYSTKEINCAVYILYMISKKSEGSITAKKLSEAGTVKYAYILSMLQKLNNAGIVEFDRHKKGTNREYSLPVEISKITIYDLYMAIQAKKRNASFVPLRSKALEQINEKIRCEMRRYSVSELLEK